MALLKKLDVQILRFQDGRIIMSGTAVTRAAARAELAAYEAAIGSVYESTDRTYKKIANAGADADLYKVTMSDAD